MHALAARLHLSPELLEGGHVARSAFTRNVGCLAQVHALIGAPVDLEWPVQRERIGELLGLPCTRRESRLRLQPPGHLGRLAQRTLQRNQIQAEDVRLASDLPRLHPVCPGAAVDGTSEKLALERDL